ncbi:antibiotic biosynthesis monooxygenase family protein [Danxiaibacter flavus]|uniref:Antibiotic biosynthesis monooxygenase family protein n=1 Tax=Danxiaibacter flavus TaxID=3049108 RepID=A0ABV3ZHY7_9BACT|nr:antibiotic biosynthesis monooxygenase family protein [Chitinophagaceae bacterium DXS]
MKFKKMLVPAMRKITCIRMFIVTVICCLITSFFTNASAQNGQRFMRVARIVVDSAQLDDYKAALKEGMESAVRTEPGVLSLYAVYDKEEPTHVTVFEIYLDEDAYKAHIQTPHFKKYKSTVQNMVKSLELSDVSPIALEAKSKL